MLWANEGNLVILSSPTRLDLREVWFWGWGQTCYLLRRPTDMEVAPINDQGSFEWCHERGRDWVSTASVYAFSDRWRFYILQHPLACVRLNLG